MKSRLRIVLIAAFTTMLFAGGPAHSEEAVKKPARAEIVSSITPEALRDLMQEAGYSVEVDEDGDIRWRLDGYQALIFIAENRMSLLFYAGFSDTSATLERVNEWNRTRKYSRSYLDGDGDPVLELDLDLEGGVTPDRIRDFLRTCRDSFSAWRREVVQ